MPHGLGHQYLLQTVVHNDFDASSIPFEDGELIRMDCDNGTFRTGASFASANKPNNEFQFALLSIDGRIDMVRYELPEDRHFVEVSATNQEIAIEGVYVYREQASKTFSFHVGGGTNVGYSYDGKVHIRTYYETDSETDTPNTVEETDLEYDQKNSINQRIFIQGGLGIRFLKKMEFGLILRRGLGYRATLDGPFKFTTLKRSIGLSLNYTL